MNDKHYIIIGKSNHFIQEISKITKNIEVISWRYPKFKPHILTNHKKKLYTFVDMIMPLIAKI